MDAKEKAEWKAHLEEGLNNTDPEIIASVNKAVHGMNKVLHDEFSPKLQSGKFKRNGYLFCWVILSCLSALTIRELQALQYAIEGPTWDDLVELYLNRFTWALKLKQIEDDAPEIFKNH